MLVAEASPENQVSSCRTSSSSVPHWLEYIAPDFAQANTNTIAGAKKLIEAKKALRKSKGSFRQLVEGLGMDLDKAERLMVIARHPVLSDSAHARNLPLSWMTQFTLAKIPAEVLAQLIADETVHPGLERKEAERLVEKVRRQNSTNGGGGEAHAQNQSGGGDGDDGGDHDDPRDASGDEDDYHHDPSADDHEKPVEAINTPVAQNAVGENSPGEIARLKACIDDLQNAKRQVEIKAEGLNSEIEELKAKLDETAVRHQRRLFRRMLDSIQKAEAPDILAKEKRSLHNSVITDLTEFVRSAARDGLSVARFDVFCRPETRNEELAREKLALRSEIEELKAEPAKRAPVDDGLDIPACRCPAHWRERMRPATGNNSSGAVRECAKEGGTHADE